MTSDADPIEWLSGGRRRGADRLDELDPDSRAAVLADLAVAAHRQPVLQMKLQRLLDRWCGRAGADQMPRNLCATLVTRMSHHPNPDRRQVAAMLAAVSGDELAARLAARHFARPHDPWRLPADIVELAAAVGHLDSPGQQIVDGLLCSERDLDARQIVDAAAALTSAPRPATAGGAAQVTVAP